MFGRFRRENEILKRRIARLEAQLHQPVVQAPGFDVGNLVTAAASSQAQTLESMGGFIKMLSDIMVERAAVTLGRSGGRRRAAAAKRDNRGRMLPKAASSNCPLCRDPMTGDFTMAEFEEHQKHKGRRLPGAEEPREAAEDVPFVPVPQRQEELPHVLFGPELEEDRRSGGHPESAETNGASPADAQQQGHFH